VKLSTKNSAKNLSVPMVSATSSGDRPPARSLLANLLLIGISGGLVLWSLQFLKTRLTSVVSVDAMVNAAITDIKAPAEGTVADMVVTTGEIIAQGQQLFVLRNDRISQLQPQELSGKLNQQRAQLRQAEQRLAAQMSLLDTLIRDEQNQGRLEISEAQQAVDQLASDLEGARSRQRLAQTTYDRTLSLQTAGAINQAALDAARADLEQRRSDVTSLEARLNSTRVNKEAAVQGLSLSRTRSNYDPRIRRQELELQIADQRLTIQALQQSVKDMETAVAQAQKDVQVQKQTVITAPNAGILWQTAVEPGRVVQPGEFMGKLVDCKRRWVDAVVEESAVKSLKVGDAASIDLYATDGTVSLQGNISQIRSGLGRVSSPGQDIPGPVDLNLPRHAQVRIALEPTAQEVAYTEASRKNFCYVGYTGKAALKVQPDTLNTNPLVSLMNALHL
jgi:multidrug resistance efflux pump